MLAAFVAVLGASSSARDAPRPTQDPSYNPIIGREIVGYASLIASGQYQWAFGCKGKEECVPYLWGAGHGQHPGPSEGKCGDGWKLPKGAPRSLKLYDGPLCKEYRPPNKNGASNGTFGLDCSGFTRWVYDLVYGKDVLGAGNTASQPHRPGMASVPAADREPGELLSYPGHVGIYAGDRDGRPAILNEPHSYNLRRGTSGKAVSDWVTAYAGLTVLSSAQAKIATYSRYTGSPKSTATVVFTDGAGTYTSLGLSGNVTVGPDGRVWLVGATLSKSSGQISSFLQAVNPVTTAIKSYPLSYPGGALTYDGELAFAGDGDLWLSATEADGTGVVMRYVMATGGLAEFPTPAACNGPQFYTAVSLFAASDGSLWLTCLNASDDTVLEQITSSGPGTPIQAPAAAPELGPLTPGAGGTMWAIGYSYGESAIVEITPAGQETVFQSSDNENAIDIVGNGSGTLVAVGNCQVSGVDDTCFFDVAADGTETMIAVAPEYEGYNSNMVLQPTMDASGNVWQLVDKATLEPSGGQYYFEVASNGDTKKYPLVLPGDSLGLQPGGPPVVTADGVVWDENVGDPGNGELVRFAPG